MTPNPISRSRGKLQVCFCCRSLWGMCSMAYWSLFSREKWANVASWTAPLRFFQKYKNPLRCWCLTKWFNYKEKWKSRFASTIEISSVKTESNRCLHRKPDIILWSLRSFWVERFDLNQSLKIDSWRKSFLDQYTSLSQNRLFPRSRLGRMTYRKLRGMQIEAIPLLIPPACYI